MDQLTLQKIQTDQEDQLIVQNENRYCQLKDINGFYIKY